MKTFIKRSVTGLVIVFALLGLGGTIAFASGYINWGGTEDYHQASNNLDSINKGVDTLFQLLTDEEKTTKALRTKNESLAEDLRKEKGTADTLRTEKETLEQELEDERDAGVTLENNLNNLKEDITGAITGINGAKGKGNKFDAAQSQLNTIAEDWGLGVSVGGTEGDESKSPELEQAEKDMKIIRDKTDTIKEKLTDVETEANGDQN